MNITVDKKALGALSKKLGLVRGSERRATMRALNRATQRTHTAIIREAAGDLGVTQKRLRRRIRRQRRDLATAETLHSQVFLVVSDAPVSWQGKPRQTAAGVRVKGRMYERAFVATVGKHTGVYRRKQMGAGTMTPKQYQAIMMRGMVKESRKYRFPIAEIKGTVRVLLRRIGDSAIVRVGEPEFRARLLHELKREFEGKQ